MAAPATQSFPRACPSLRHDLDLSVEQLNGLLDLTQQVKQSRQRYASALKGRYVCLLFEKPSLRTRMTFELAMKQLGGDCVTQTGMIAEREPLKDVARNLARWTDAIVARTFQQETIDELARWSGMPVVNALSDLYHPCQALADMFTLKEHFGRLRGLKLGLCRRRQQCRALVAAVLRALGYPLLGCDACGLRAESRILSTRAASFAVHRARTSKLSNDPIAAVRGADAVYTDVWASMGQESEAAERNAIFAPYQVNEAADRRRRKDALFMHCLPAKRGLEVTDAVMESPQSVVFDQAENRLHVQKALLLTLLQ